MREITFAHWSIEKSDVHFFQSSPLCQVLTFTGCVQVRVLAGLIHCNGLILKPSPSYHSLYSPHNHPHLSFSPMDPQIQVSPHQSLHSHLIKGLSYKISCCLYRTRSLRATWLHSETGRIFTFIPSRNSCLVHARGRRIQSAKVKGVYMWTSVGKIRPIKSVYWVCYWVWFHVLNKQLSGLLIVVKFACNIILIVNYMMCTVLGTVHIILSTQTCILTTCKNSIYKTNHVVCSYMGASMHKPLSCWCSAQVLRMLDI